MKELRVSDPGSQIAAVFSDVTVAEISSAAQLLSDLTANRSDLPMLSDRREMYWRQRIVEIVFRYPGHDGIVIDERLDGGGGTGGIDGVLMAEDDQSDRSQMLLLACVGSDGTVERLKAQGRALAQSRGRTLVERHVEVTWRPV